jgi:hypothetical protein
MGLSRGGPLSSLWPPELLDHVVLCCIALLDRRKEIMTMLCAPTYSESFRRRSFPRFALSGCVLTSVHILLWRSTLIYSLRIETRSLCGCPILCGTLSGFWSNNSPPFLCPFMSLDIFERRLFPSLPPSSMAPGLFGYCATRRPSSQRVGLPRC